MEVYVFSENDDDVIRGLRGSARFRGCLSAQVTERRKGGGGIEGERETKIIGFQPDLCQSRWG